MALISKKRAAPWLLETRSSLTFITVVCTVAIFTDGFIYDIVRAKIVYADFELLMYILRLYQCFLSLWKIEKMCHIIIFSSVALRYC